MQINRLFEIVYILLEKKKITAKELAEKFEVSTRTIYRDIDILSSANIPIYCNKGKGGGIGLLDDFVFDKSLLSEQEQNEILTALQGLEKLKVIQGKETLQKMTTLFHKNTTPWIDIDFSDWSNQEENKFELLKKAIINHKVVEFTYYNSMGEEIKRKVEPLQIKFKDKAWYLIGYCKTKEGYRFFKIPRMYGLKVLEETFDRKLPEVKEEPIQIQTVTLKLEIAKELSYRIYDEFRPEDIKKKENGDFIITISYPENDWVYGYLLSFGDKIKIIEPDYVKDKILKKVEKMKENYKI